MGIALGVIATLLVVAGLWLIFRAIVVWLFRIE
jgi:hypothetical protein